MTDGRVSTTTGRLVRLGFEDAGRVAAVLDRLGPAADELLHMVATTADPDQAVGYLADLVERVEDRDALLTELVEDEGTAMRLLSVLGASSALGDHLLRHPEHWQDLTDPALGSTRPAAYAVRAALLAAVGADPTSDEPVASGRTPTGWTRCAWPTGGCCSGWPPATCRTPSASTTWPRSCRTSRRGRSTPRWPSPGHGSVTPPATPGWRSSRWASAVGTS